jgi:hypothetical protein
VRKKRKLTPEQKEALVERLAKARAAKGEPEYKTIYPTVVALPDDHPLSLKNCKYYIKTQQSMMSRYRSEMKNDIKGAKGKYHQCEGYIRNIQTYLKTGTWVDMFYGELQQYLMGWRVVVPAGQQDTN